MKFAEIRLHDSAPDATGAQTATFRNVDADVEPWGLWVGTLLLPWGSIRYARREHVKLDAMGSWTVPLGSAAEAAYTRGFNEVMDAGVNPHAHPYDAIDPELGKAIVESAELIARLGGEPSVIAIQAEDLARLRVGISPHDVEQLRDAQWHQGEIASQADGSVVMKVDGEVRQVLPPHDVDQFPPISPEAMEAGAALVNRLGDMPPPDWRPGDPFAATDAIPEPQPKRKRGRKPAP